MVRRLANVLAGFVVLTGPSVLATQERPAQKECPPCALVIAAQRDAELPVEALKDRAWALGPKGLNVPWPVDVPTNPAPDTRLPGAGATIVQIDTGVTRHPLLHEATGTDGGVDFTAADGLFGIGQTNIDPLLTGFLRFPGHGTKTSSVIISRPTEIMKGIHGVAPGARVIPVRATEGVVLFDGPIGQLNADYHRIARALNEAAQPNGGLFGRKIDVVSMSLGGWPPSADLCLAVKNATDAGVIVVVAAGNEVKRTKYPAKCATAIAIGGSNYQQQPWSGSAGSPEVVVAAPAEGVWTAAVMNGVPCVEASSGTSFATALMAGVAAEWVGRKRAVGTAMPAQPSEAFRAELKASVRPWTGSRAADWAKKFGPGIADVTKLFQQGR